MLSEKQTEGIALVFIFVAFITCMAAYIAASYQGYVTHQEKMRELQEINQILGEERMNQIKGEYICKITGDTERYCDD